MSQSWVPDWIDRLGCKVKIRSIHEKEFQLYVYVHKLFDLIQTATWYFQVKFFQKCCYLATKIKNKMVDFTNLATEATLNAKATQDESKMADTKHMATSSEFNKLMKENFWCKNERKQWKSSKLNFKQIAIDLDIVDKNREKIIKL